MPPLSAVKTHSTELLEMQHSTDSLGSSPMSVMVATGPFTIDNNLNYEPFDALMSQVEKRQPDVLVLVRKRPSQYFTRLIIALAWSVH